MLPINRRRGPRADENAADEWRAYRDIDDELPVFCPECAQRDSPVCLCWRVSPFREAAALPR